MSENHQNDTSLVDGGKLFGPEISLVNIDEIWATGRRLLSQYGASCTDDREMRMVSQNL